MLLAVILMMVVVLAVPAFLVLTLRRWGRGEEQVEERLRAPQTHKVSYLVPEGEDPAVLRGALARAGFVTAMDTSGDERLFVECEETERHRVREVIEEVERGSSSTAARVLFEDERAQR